MSQRGLFDAVDRPEVRAARASRSGTREERFYRFHAANPEVYAELVRRATMIISRGHVRLGIALLWESMRYDVLVSTTRERDDFKLNNDVKAFYSRLIMIREPHLADVFEIREADVSADFLAWARSGNPEVPKPEA